MAFFRKPFFPTYPEDHPVEYEDAKAKADYWWRWMEIIYPVWFVVAGIWLMMATASFLVGVLAIVLASL